MSIAVVIFQYVDMGLIGQLRLVRLPPLQPCRLPRKNFDKAAMSAKLLTLALLIADASVSAQQTKSAFRDFSVAGVGIANSEFGESTTVVGGSERNEANAPAGKGPATSVAERRLA